MILSNGVLRILPHLSMIQHCPEACVQYLPDTIASITPPPPPLPLNSPHTQINICIDTPLHMILHMQLYNINNISQFRYWASAPLFLLHQLLHDWREQWLNYFSQRRKYHENRQGVKKPETLCHINGSDGYIISYSPCLVNASIYYNPLTMCDPYWPTVSCNRSAVCNEPNILLCK